METTDLGHFLALPPARPVRGGFISSALDLIKMGGAVPRRNLEPRKGGTLAGLQPMRAYGADPTRRPDPPNFLMPVPALRNLAERDDIIFAIRRTLRMAIGEMKWRVTPDLEAVKSDLKRWHTTMLANIAMPGLSLEFTPQALSAQIYVHAHGELRSILMDILSKGEDPQNHRRLHDFFENILAAQDAIAQDHIAPVEALFNKPNPSSESSWRALMSIILDDMTLFDAAGVVKNVTLDGKLAELYTIPGEGIRVYRMRDNSTPVPPEVAYDWVDSTKVRAYFNNDELVYFMANPQQNGYGRSPLLSLVQKMAGAIYADAYMLDDFANNNMPFFAFDLGPNVSQYEKDAIENAWNNKVVGGRFRGIFMANKEGVKGFIPMPTPQDRTDSTIERLKFWANVKCACFGLSLNDIGFTEDLHRTTAETQAELTQSRGIYSFAKILEGYINGEIVKGRMWLRDDPEDETCMSGKSVPCYPFSDVKFEYERASPMQRLEEAKEMMPFIATGAVSINEVRKLMLLPPVPGGDEFVTSISSPILVDKLADIQTQQPQQSQDGKSMPGEEKPALPPGQSKDDVSKGIESIERVVQQFGKLVGG